MSTIETRSKKAQSQERESEESGSSSKTEQTSGTEQTSSTERTSSTEQTTTTEDSSPTLKNVQSKNKPKKAGSRASNSKRAELEAKLELQNKAIEKAEAEAAAARTRLELAQLADHSDLEDEAEKIELVNDWISKSPNPASKPINHEKDMDVLSRLLSRALKNNEQDGKQENAPKKPPAYMSDLPPFDGDPINWIPFFKHYTSTASYFIDIENIARIRRALRGPGKEAVKSLLYTSSTPDNILKELERRFGQPTYIIKSLIADLHKLPRMTDDLRGIGAFASAVFNSVDTIKQLDQLEYLYSTEITEKIVDKMSTLVRFRWQEFKADRRREPMLNVLSDFLTKISNDFDEPTVNERPRFKPENKSRPFRKARVNVTHHDDSDSDGSYDSEFEEEMRIVLATSTLEEEKCLLCEQPHGIAKCDKFAKETVKQRWETVKRLKVCFKCLRSDHRHFTCKSKPCGKEDCTRTHHELLHQTRTRPEANKVVSVNHVGTSRTYLKIIPVELSGPNGSTQVTALLDEGSTVTLLLDEVADSIGATGPNRSLLIEGISGHQIKTEDSKNVKLKIKGLFSRSYEDIQAHTINKLNLRPQTVMREDLEDCFHLDDIKDQLIYNGTPPTLLIGQDNWHLIVTRDLKAGHPSRPVASLTSLGWILHGCKTESTKPVLFINHTYEKKADDIDQIVKDYFSLDSLGIMPRKPTNDPEQRALNLLEKTTHRLPEGRFECGLLWRKDNEEMPANRHSALRRLKGIESKLQKNEDLKIKYTQQITNLLTNGYAEIAVNKPTSPRTWYLPHFAVVHPQKGKLRLVFDAAERTNGKSLNDALLSGPDLLQSLFGVLIRFRQGPIAVAADIKEMFLRVKIREEDRDSLRFLWRENQNDEHPKEYRMNSLIFGATSSPCSAIFVKNRNAQDFRDKYPEAVNSIEKCHYMDDYLQSFATPEEALRISRQVDLIHRSGGFELRGWTSNHQQAIKGLEATQPECINLGDHDKYGKTLGMLWQVDNDSFKFTLTLRNTPEDVRQDLRPPTKREVASAVMSVFDPLGLATPILLQGKILIQQLWRSGTNWDEPIPDSIREQWTNWLGSLQNLKNLNIPRCTNSQDEGELHTFVDASETAYAAATYWRSTNKRKPTVQLIAAKAKVAPLKPTSIPRLELQAALLGCRLATGVQNEMPNPVQRKFYWSDSRTVLAWIKSDPRTYKTFVAHRLAEIEDLTLPTEWRYIPTKQNVADDATRTPPGNFNAEHRWFNGPEFLTLDQSQWPKDHSARPTSATGEEKQTVAAVNSLTTSLINEDRFSSWIRLLRATARLLQSVDKFKTLIRHKESTTVAKHVTKDQSWKPYHKRKKIQIKPVPSQPESQINSKYIKLTNEHLEQAERLLIQKIQKETFQAELHHLQLGKKFHKQSRLKRLTVTINNDVMCLETRLFAARDMWPTYRRPVILHGKHPITRLIIAHYHQEHNHGNHNTVMNELRQKYYVIALRNTLKMITRECQWCRTRKTLTPTAPLGDLPAERLQQNQHPFTCTAVDYFGPLTITVGRKTAKRWIALYTCMTTRAVHLEIATSLSTNSMILTLRRMIARRGTPKIMYSDNGTNFVGANKELQQEFQNMVDKTEEKGIQWKFIPPGAPHMGGTWERLVRSVKTALTATLNTRHPSEEILHTLLLEAEHLVNSRPITEVTLDPDEQEGLTPNHFLIGRSNGAYRMGSFSDHDLIGPATWKTIQRLTDLFWKRWLVEYLPTITPKYNKCQGAFTNPAIGDVVIIADNSLPRGIWPKGEITQLYPGPDGHVRVVNVRTTAGTLKRPTSRLIKITQSSAAIGGASDSIFARGGDC